MNILNISIGIAGLASSLTGLNALTTSATQAYAANENLVNSLDALVAKQIALANEMELVEARRRSTAVTRELVEWTQKLGIQSPFSQEGIANSFKMAMSFGMNIKMAKEATVALIDFTAATGQSAYVMEGAMMALGQAFSKGKLQGEEALQLIERGVPVWEYLRRATGKTNAELQDMSSKGLISAKQAIDALVKGIKEDFGGAAVASQYTIDGLISSFDDLATVAKRKLYAPSIQSFTPTLIEITDTAGSLETIKKIEYASIRLTETTEKIIPAFKRVGEVVGTVFDGLWNHSLLSAPMEKMFGINNIEAAFGVVKGTVSSLLDLIGSSQSVIMGAIHTSFMYKLSRSVMSVLPSLKNFIMDIPNIFWSTIARGGAGFVIGNTKAFFNIFTSTIKNDFVRNFIEAPIISALKNSAISGWGAFMRHTGRETRELGSFISRWANDLPPVFHNTFGRLVTSYKSLFNTFKTQINQMRGFG